MNPFVADLLQKLASQEITIPDYYQLMYENGFLRGEAETALSNFMQAA